jgi:hypothetical protein
MWSGGNLLYFHLAQKNKHIVGGLFNNFWLSKKMDKS